MARVRILVLSSSTGAGHDARAQAFAEWCFELYRHDVDVRIEQMLENSSRAYRAGVKLYNWIQRRSPRLHKAFYTFIELLSVVNRSTVRWGRGYYEKVLLDYRPHLVLSVHDCLNRGYFQLARRILGESAVCCATYCGEFSGGFGYSGNWVEPTADLYFSRTETARDYAVKLGMPPEKTRVRGYLMRPRAHLEVLNEADRPEFRRTRLNLASEKFTVFLATGGNGANNHLALLPRLLPYAGRLQAIVICGNSRDTYNEVVHWRAEHPELECFVDGYSEEVHLLLQASDAIVTRGGTTTCAKALHFRCPIIFNAIGGVMPQEQLTVKFFRNGGGAEIAGDADEFADIIARWMDDASEYERLRQGFLDLRYEEDPTGLIDELVGEGCRIAGVELDRQPWPPEGRTGVEPVHSHGVGSVD